MAEAELAAGGRNRRGDPAREHSHALVQRRHQPAPAAAPGQCDQPGGRPGLAPPLAGHDEIAELDRVFHHMADSLDEVTRREKAVIEGTTDAIFVKNLEHRYLMMNEAGAAMIGRPVADIIGASNDELIEAESARQIRAAGRGGDRRRSHDHLRIQLHEQSRSASGPICRTAARFATGTAPSSAPSASAATLPIRNGPRPH